MKRPNRTGLARQQGKQIPELLVIAVVISLFLACAIPAFRAARDSGFGVWMSLLGSAIGGALGFGVILGLLTVLGLVLDACIDLTSLKVGKRVKVPYGTHRGERGVVEAMPQDDGLVRIRLEKDNRVMLMPEWLFSWRDAFDGQEYRWLREGAHVHIGGIHHTSGVVLRHDEDTHAVLVLPDGKDEPMWLSPNFLEKPREDSETTSATERTVVSDTVPGQD